MHTKKKNYPHKHASYAQIFPYNRKITKHNKINVRHDKMSGPVTSKFRILCQKQVQCSEVAYERINRRYDPQMNKIIWRQQTATETGKSSVFSGARGNTNK